MGYFNNIIIKKCINCKNDFNATQKQTLCVKCRKIVRIRNFKNSLKTIKQDIHCKYCKEYIYTIEKKQTRKIHSKIYIRVCKKCKKNNRIIKSQKMKDNNPMFKKEVIQKGLITKYGKIPEKNIPIYKQLGFKSFNEFMKENNPMFNKKTVDKVKETYKHKIENGELVYKKGINHHNFKGLRNINKAIRDDLKEWKKNILKECDYKCIECEINNNNLHVHHTEQLHKIILKICYKHNINSKTLKDGTNDFYLVKNEVLKYHTENNIGIVLCEDCHDLMDIHYHKRKNNENKKNYKGKI